MGNDTIRYGRIFSSHLSAIGQFVCYVIMSRRVSIVKKYILERHYRVKHSGEYSKYTTQEKLKIFERLKLAYQEDDNTYDSLLFIANNDDAKAASYSISFLIAKHSKKMSH